MPRAFRTQIDLDIFFYSDQFGYGKHRLDIFVNVKLSIQNFCSILFKLFFPNQKFASRNKETSLIQI